MTDPVFLIDTRCADVCVLTARETHKREFFCLVLWSNDVKQDFSLNRGSHYEMKTTRRTLCVNK